MPFPMERFLLLCFGRMPPFFHPSNQHLLTVPSFSWQMLCPEAPGGAGTEALFPLSPGTGQGHALELPIDMVLLVPANAFDQT